MSSLGCTMSTTTELENSYFLRVPTPSSIYRITPEDTLTVLHDINQSRSVDKRFPTEILILIAKEVHATYEIIRSTWTAITHNIVLEFGCITGRDLFYDKEKKIYYPALDIPRWWTDPANWDKIGPEGAGFPAEIHLYRTVSSADLLYRLRCFFPEVYIKSVGRNGYKTIWTAGVRHTQSGVMLMFHDYKGAVDAYAIQGRRTIDMKDAAMNFSGDAAELLNTFFETIDGTRRFAYFHPAADANYPTADERFLAVPDFTSARLRNPESRRSYRPWDSESTVITDTDFTSFKSLLPSMKYNVNSRKVDAINGTEDLTTIVSSSLLFYRLLCHFVWDDNNADTPPITSVWQVKLRHRLNGTSLLFMDDHGVFDIRADEEAEEVMEEIADLVNALCSNECSHPYDGVLAGCVA